MTLGQDTFALNKGQYAEKLTRIINNHRPGTKIIGEPLEFVLRSCRLTEQWTKLASDPDVAAYLRNVSIAGGRKVKMLSLERGETKQPVSKSKLVDVLYPVKKIATTATPEEKPFAINHQLKAFRDAASLPTVCSITGKNIRKGMKTDIDHCGMSFSELADRFVATRNLKYCDIALMGPPTGKSFRDKHLWGEWVSFHLELARFALVCSSANRSKGSDGYKPDPGLIGSFKSEDPEDLSLDF